jgi:hypothetical protein
MFTVYTNTKNKDNCVSWRPVLELVKNKFDIN